MHYKYTSITDGGGYKKKTLARFILSVLGPVIFLVVFVCLVHCDNLFFDNSFLQQYFWEIIFFLYYFRYAIGNAERLMLNKNIGWLHTLGNDIGEPYFENKTGGPSIKASSIYICVLFVSKCSIIFCFSLFPPKHHAPLVSVYNRIIFYIYVIDLGRFWECGTKFGCGENIHSLCDASGM